ncbi:MAG: glycoside hydrolase family 10 protein [Armatimonadota bacterium]
MDYDWIFTDFTFLPPDLAGRKAQRGRWQLVDYTTAEFAGTLILANPGVGAPEVRIPLPLTGRYDLYLGFLVNLGDRLKVKLAGDRCYERLSVSVPAQSGAFQDVFFRTVELTGSDVLLLKQDTGAYAEVGLRAAVGYILAKKAKERPDANADLLLHVTDDGWPSNWGFPEDHEDHAWLVEPQARLGAKIVSFGIDIHGMANYATRHDSLRLPAAEIAREYAGTFPYDNGAKELPIIAEEIREGFQVPELYYRRCWEQGMRPFAYCRMAHVHPPPPYDAEGSALYDAHPEYRCIDIDGTPVARLSIAFPEVRAEFLKLFTEQVEMGAEGVNNVFVRGVPMVLYEEPVRDRFRELHGEEITGVAADDPRAQAVRAEFMTAFMREQRAALAAAGPERKTSVIATVPATRTACEFFGLDIPAWIREGLIDILCPYEFGFDPTPVPLELDFFCDAAKGSGVLLLPFINTWASTTEAILEKAMQYRRWPIDGLSVWDANSFVDRRRWIAYRSLGSDDAIRDALARIKVGPVHRTLITYNGVADNRYHYGWNF